MRALSVVVVGGFGLVGLAGCGPVYGYGYYDEPAYGMTAPDYEVPVVEQSEVEVTVELFYEELAPYGDFIEHGSLGRVWAPHDASYVPYANGNWQYTEHGFTWVSKDPFGWAVCHYGRWVWADRWLWVPGTVWGPAWVIWRESDAVAGWAPMPPLGYPEPPRETFIFVDVSYLFVEELHHHYYDGWSAYDAYASTSWVDDRAYLPGGYAYCPGPRADRLRRRGVPVHVWPYRPDRRPPIAVRRPGARGRMPVDVRRPSGERAAVEVRRPGGASEREPVAVRRPAAREPIEVRRPEREPVGVRRPGLAASPPGAGGWGYVRAREPARASVGSDVPAARMPEVVTIRPRPPVNDDLARIEPHAMPVDDRAAREAIRAAEERHRMQAGRDSAAIRAEHHAAFEAQQRAAADAQHRAAAEAQQRAAVEAQRHAAIRAAQHRAAIQAQQSAAFEAQHRAAAERAAAQAQHQAAIQAQHRAAAQAQHQAAIQAQHRAAAQAQHQAAIEAQHRAAAQAQHQAAIRAQQQVAAEQARRRAVQATQPAPRAHRPRSIRAVSPGSVRVTRRR